MRIKAAVVTIIFISTVSGGVIAQEIAVCSGLDPNDATKIVDSIECINFVASDFSIPNCMALDKDTRGHIAKAAICTGLISSRLLEVEAVRKETNEKLKNSISINETKNAEIVSSNQAFDDVNSDLNEKSKEITGLTTRLRAAEAAITSRNKQIDQLQKRVSSVKIGTWHTFSVGEYDRGAAFSPRHYCYTDVKAEAANLCGRSEVNLKLVRDQGGDKCGYQDYVVACINR